MAINELNELKINVNVTPEVNVKTTITQSAEIIAKVTSGARGKSAYEIWLDEGHAGTETDFLNWLKQDSFTYTQISSTTEWTITHNLGKYPSVSVVDSGGNWVIGDVRYINENELVVSFLYEFSGKAYLNQRGENAKIFNKY